ncbi:MAG: PEP-CTERM sorting domain-containing protein [Planctomycetota bacterium]
MNRVSAFLIPITSIAFFGPLLSDSSEAAIVTVAEQKSVVTDSLVQQVPLEVYLDLTEGDDGGTLQVGNFQIRVQLNGTGAGSGVSVVDVGNTQSVLHPQGRSLDDEIVFSPTQGIGATSNFFDPFDLADGAGLMEITLEIQPNFIGDISIDFLVGEGNTLFTDPNDFSTLLAPIETTSGSLSVTAVPEPSSFAMLGLVLMLVYRVCGSRQRLHRAAFSHLD